jgi:CRISPR system Cascade subunit CasA
MPDGRKMPYSLKDIFKDAPYIKEIVDDSPLVTVALHRFLLAILHRSLSISSKHNVPKDERDWQAIWRKGYFEDMQILVYLNQFRDRFDLFDDKYPFYQCSEMPINCIDNKGQLKSYTKSVANLVHELATGNNATLFDHTVEDKAEAISPARAANLLVAFQAFSIGGLLTYQEGQDPQIYKSSTNAPLVKGAVIMIKGRNLFETLVLNMHKYNKDDSEPMEIESDDLPAWENNDCIIPIERYPKGYLDILTWQSRSIKLIPEQDDIGNTIIKQVVIMKGEQLPNTYSLYQKEPMLAYKKVKKPTKNQAPWSVLTFKEEKALWRDSLSLFQSLEEERVRPKILNWLNELSSIRIIDISMTYNLSIIGLATNQAKVLLWRHENIPLALEYLKNKELINSLSKILGIAETIGTEIKKTAWLLSKMIITPSVKTLNETQKNEVNNFSDHLAIDRPYWAQLGISFNKLLVNLPNDKINIQGDTIYGLSEMQWWAKEVSRVAIKAFNEATSGLDQNANSLKAVTIARDNFNYRLNATIKEFTEPYMKLLEKGGEKNE